MREIKFRVWDHSHQEMVNSVSVIHCDLLNKTDLRYYVDRTYTLVRADNIDVELMQSTGLIDKNGVEIYEGDIVQLVDLDFGDLGRYEVEFNDESAGFVMYFNQEIRHFIDHHSEDEIEVIGDIYRTPELLEE